MQEVSQLLGQPGNYGPKKGFRTALRRVRFILLKCNVVVNNVAGLSKGCINTPTGIHELVKVFDKNVLRELAAAALGQSCVRDAALVLVFTAVYERTTGKYGDRGIRYVHMEVGHAAQNVCLQAVSLGLGTVVVGAFRDEEVKKVLSLPKEEHPLCIMPMGRI